MTPIYFLNTINDAAALLFARGADFLSVFDKPQRDALVVVFLRMHGQGILANEVFWTATMAIFLTLALYRLFKGVDKGLARLVVIHSHQAVCGRECERNGQQYRGARNAFPSGHCERSLLILNCFAYLATSVTGILWPQFEQRVSNWVFPVMFGELAIMLWLIIMGAKETQPLATAA